MEKLPIPTAVIEVKEALPTPVKEKDGIGFIEGAGIIALVVIVAIAAKKVRCCKKK